MQLPNISCSETQGQPNGVDKSNHVNLEGKEGKGTQNNTNFTRPKPALDLRGPP